MSTTRSSGRPSMFIPKPRERCLRSSSSSSNGKAFKCVQGSREALWHSLLISIPWHHLHRREHQAREARHNERAVPLQRRADELELAATAARRGGSSAR